MVRCARDRSVVSQEGLEKRNRHDLARRSSSSRAGPVLGRIFLQGIASGSFLARSQDGVQGNSRPPALWSVQGLAFQGRVLEGARW